MPKLVLPPLVAPEKLANMSLATHKPGHLTLRRPPIDAALRSAASTAASTLFYALDHEPGSASSICQVICRLRNRGLPKSIPLLSLKPCSIGIRARFQGIESCEILRQWEISGRFRTRFIKSRKNSRQNTRSFIAKKLLSQKMIMKKSVIFYNT